MARAGLDPSIPVTRGVVGELFWNITQPVLILDGSRIVGWNPAAESTFGVPATVAMADGFDLALVFGAALPQLRALAADGGWQEFACAGGCNLHLRATAWHIGDDPTRPTVVVMRNLTEEERYVDGLKRLNEIARDLLGETSPEVLYQRVADEAKTLLDASYSALIVLREGSDDEIEHFAYNAPRELFPDRLPRCVGLLAVPIQTGAAARLDDIRGHPAGVGIPVAHPPVAALLAVPIQGPDGVAGELAVANSPGSPTFDAVDEALLTELAAHAALAISLSATRAAQQEAELTRVGLTRLALHNLRTPLAVAIGAAEALRRVGDGIPDDQRDTLLDMLDRSLKRAGRVSEEVLIAETSGDADTPIVEPVDLNALVADVVEAHQDTAARGSVTLEVEIDPDVGVVDIAGRVVRSALDNLLSNALRFSPEGERVVITCRPEGHAVRVDVSDRGPGIRPEHQSAIFEGVGAHRPVGDRRGGAGVGLSIARRLLRAAGGQIGVASQPGHGSTFWISVPVR